jgi:hypothetical protein
MSSPLAKRLANSGVILVSPTPRYFKWKCDRSEHTENSVCNDYEDDLAEDQDQYRRLLGGWG